MLLSAHLGNGLSIWRKGENYFIAHISPNREVKFYYDDLTEEEKEEIELLAKTDDREISVTQKEKVFINRPIL